ncbi:MAG: hypothetical protein GDA56_08885 [Hormoscilla sp. GM7CHS1pb]|nr:hypothetical protein [Hormoscilla sp. GM7CHS1pb]
MHQPIDKETAKSAVKQLYQLAERATPTFEFVPSRMAAINLANKQFSLKLGVLNGYYQRKTRNSDEC